MISDEIWEYGTSFQGKEIQPVADRKIREEGFEITEGIAEIRTAFKACYGSGKPVIAFLGEYDALPLLSQEADALEKKEERAGSCGHGCGHQLLGTGSIQAAVAVKDYIRKQAWKVQSLFWMSC